MVDIFLFAHPVRRRGFIAARADLICFVFQYLNCNAGNTSERFIRYFQVGSSILPRQEERTNERTNEMKPKEKQPPTSNPAALARGG